MADCEWPKIMAVESGMKSLDRPIEVIPADLGRELYRATKDYLANPTHVETQDSLYHALARYEREVEDRG